MKKKEKNNYIILIILLLVTVVLTMFLSKLYLNKTKKLSSFYLESNKITPKEFEEVSIEEPDVIYYMADKYDLTNEEFESEFKMKMEQKNLISKLVYVDSKRALKKKIKEIYKVEIREYPAIVFVVDKKVIKIIYIKDNNNIDGYIDYGVYE